MSIGPLHFENVIGGGGADQLFGDNGDNVLVGGRGATFSRGVPDVTC